MKRNQKSAQSLAQPSSLQIVLLSDTHELHREVDVPSGDILIHAGDFTMFSRSRSAIVDFNDWLGESPHRWKVVVPGNHESFLQIHPANRSLISNAAVLVNESVEIAGLRIWGSPVTHASGPAFTMALVEERRRLYAGIPENVDILITHAPPFGVLDVVPGSDIHTGDPVLLEAVNRVRPKLHVFGHVHGAHGTLATEHTMFVNAALLGPDGDIANEPIVLRMGSK